MKRIHWLLLLVLMGAVACETLGQVVPPDTGKLSWSLFQTVESGQRKRATDEEVPRIEALLTTRIPVSEGDLATLESLGYSIHGAFGRLVGVEAPADLYADPEKGLGTLEFVLSADFPPTALPNQDPDALESLPVIHAEQAWILGYKGQGTKIAVIEWGYVSDYPDLAALNPSFYVATPAGGVGTYEFEEGILETSLDGGMHGTSCALIAARVAPEAELNLLSFPSGEDTQRDLMGWLAALSCAVKELEVDVVTTQIWFDYPTCHADGTGVLHEAVDEILSGTDTVLVVAAGNWADGSGGGRAFHADTFTDSDGEERHDFSPSAADTWDQNNLRFSGQEGDQVLIMLEWDEWASELKAMDLDLLLYDAEFSQVPLSVARTRQYERTTPPYEKMTVTLPYSGEFALVIEDRASKWYEQSSTGVHFNLYVHSYRYGFSYVEHHSVDGSTRELATSRDERVISVGAVSVTATGSVRPYSSRGPTWDGRCKPELYAPDGVSGTMYDEQGRLFTGTSASAPHVAGAVAVLRSVDPDLLPADIVSALKESSGCSASGGCACPTNTPIDLALAVQRVLAR
ncbi:MAG: S8 family serine peptidase [Candidatus Bipolaricaulia bacterium]